MSHGEVICVCSNVKLDIALIQEAGRESAEKELKANAPFIAFKPEEKCIKVINSIKQQVRTRVVVTSISNNRTGRSREGWLRKAL